jgi:hypothetical protein
LDTALTDTRFSDEGGELIIWSVAEVAITIVAATIPVLRSMSIQSSVPTQDNGAYFRSVSCDEIARRARTHKPGVNTITVSSKGRSRSGVPRPSGDSDSDKGMLFGRVSPKIMLTAEVQINYADRSDTDSNFYYELDGIEGRTRIGRRTRLGSKLPDLLGTSAPRV